MRFHRFVGRLPTALALGALIVTAGCTALPASVSRLRQQAAPATLQVQVHTATQLPSEVQTRLQAEAQVYADQVSKRRGIDLFYLHPAQLGLSFEQGEQRAWLLSFPGTSRLRTDLNLELRTLSTETHTDMNLNYSGPVTLGRSTPHAPENTTVVRIPANTLAFELITGLPGNGLTEVYGDWLERQASFLRQRFQARPFSFDDGPLIYALKSGAQVRGFVFLNQRNRLILGERKYADLQSVVFVSSAGAVEASYTIVAFNPKTSAPEQPPVCQAEQHTATGTLLICGTY